MAKTDKAKTFRVADFGIIISAAHVAAIAGLTTPERISLKTILAGQGLQQSTVSNRGHSAHHVVGDADPIIDIGPRSEEVYTANILYTEGETLGTDTLDPYEEILEPLYKLEPPLPVQFYWSPAGGNSGDNEYITDANNSFLKSLASPVGGSQAGKIMTPFSFVTPAVAPSNVA